MLFPSSPPPDMLDNFYELIRDLHGYDYESNVSEHRGFGRHSVQGTRTEVLKIRESTACSR